MFENQPNEICTHLCAKASKGTCLKTEKLQNHSKKEKRKERRERKKKKKKKKSNGYTLSFCSTYFRDGTLWQIRRILWKHLDDLIKTSLTKCSVIWVIVKRKRKGEKGRARRRKGGEEKTGNSCTLRFIIAILEIVFGRKKLLNAKGLFGDNVIKNPARWSNEMSSIDAKWPETPSAICKWHTLTDWQNSLETSIRSFENYPNKICSHLCEKASKGTFLKPKSSKIIVTKEKERTKERARRRKGGIDWMPNLPP